MNDDAIALASLELLHAVREDDTARARALSLCSGPTEPVGQ